MRGEPILTHPLEATSTNIYAQAGDLLSWRSAARGVQARKAILSLQQPGVARPIHVKPETSLCPRETFRWTYLLAGVVQGHPGHGKISASPCRTRSGISFGSGGSITSTVFPHWTRCQAISSQPLAVVRLCGFLMGRCFASDCATAKIFASAKAEKSQDYQDNDHKADDVYDPVHFIPICLESGQ